MTESPTTTAGAKRYAPEELGLLDLSRFDTRIAWAVTATASSEWSDSYSASAACGPPCVFPRFGDHEGTWLPESSDTRPFIEVTLPEVAQAHAVVVCETCGTGSVRRVRDVDRDAVLFEGGREPRADRGKAQLLVVPLPPGTPPPRRLRIELRSSRDEYDEIDAIGLLLAPLSVLMDTPPAASDARHVRFAPSEHGLHDLRGDWRLSWAKGGKASSEYSSDYAARQALGKPRVFPKGGDHARTWLSDNSDRNAWLALSFADEGPCYGFIALETCGAGAIVRATDADGTTLWQAGVEDVPRREARLLWVDFTAPRELTELRLYVSPAVSDYREIDAVALLLCPFEELREPAPPRPPPPPKPVPGEPSGRFLRLEGTLVGPSPDAPLAHVTLAYGGEKHSLNHGTATLRLDDGRALTLEIDRTIVYGSPLQRRTASFAELVRAHPFLREALGPQAPADDVEVTLVGAQLVGDERVRVAGIPITAPTGFREAAGHAQGLRVAALSSRPWDETTFGARGVHDFEHEIEAERTDDEPRVEAPFERWRRIASRTFMAAALLLALATWHASRAPELVGAPAAWLTVALLALLGSAVFALELYGRARRVTVVEDGGRARKGRVRGVPPGWTAFGTAFCVGFAMLLGAVVVASAGERVGELVLRVGFAYAGVHALVRLLLWRWSDRGALRAALPLLLSPRVTPAEGRRGVLVGALGARQRTTEAFSAHSEHLGSYQTTDDQGRVTVHERYRTWNESRLSCDAGRTTRLFLADGTPLTPARIVRVVDVGVMPKRPTGDGEYARFESRHREGDPAALLGLPVRRGDRWEVDDAVVLLGDPARLARETVPQLLALLGLLALVVAGLLAVLL